MKYIDKTGAQQEGKGIVDTLLDDAWNIEEERFRGANYEGLSHPKYKPALLNLILNEQDHLCCYCLKLVQGQHNDTNLEHVIPQQTPEAIFRAYLIVNTLSENVIHKDTFNRSTRQIPPEKYPHDIAFHNLVASCNSAKHCNNFRGNDFVSPFIFDNDIHNKVVYDASGRIDCDEYNMDFDVIGITINEKLQQIRRIWKLLSTKIENVENITLDLIEIEILSLIDEPNYEKLITDFTGYPSYKEELIKYKWFYSYYKKN